VAALYRRGYPSVNACC